MIPFVKKKNLSLHLNCDEGILYYDNKVNYNNNFKINNIKLAPIMAAYLLQCNGKLSHEDIMKKLEIPFAILGDKIFEELNKAKIIEGEDRFNYSNEIVVTGDFQSYSPVHVSVEITDYCNFQCKHCYVDASPMERKVVEYDKLIKLFKILKENGVKVVELTGGECTTHPQFKEILNFCCTNFNLVSIISNGYLIGKYKELADFIGDFKNAVVQISIDGMEKFHNYFRNKKDSFKYACKAIEYLKKKNTIVRVASAISEENIEDIVSLYKLCKKLNVDSWATTTIEDFGRGSDLYSDKFGSYVNNELKKVLKPYSNDKIFNYKIENLKAFVKNKEVNCGGGWKSFAINATSGEVRTCLFLNKYNSIGNIYKDNYKEIFNEKKTKAFKQAPSPMIELDECKECFYNKECNGCFAKAFKIAKEKNPNCLWKKKYFSKL
ncbi:radical SAM/SPASM domain-containing protein [Clostridium tarantellae]|uniref:Radical SAM protein n=1 Tax=Clostridium tarantellae TaxID=39493 RepID=A0A6I1MRE5_9CLOT|nr:radical SAM protein [Clostridium tarantellae]MPQ45048.1 radical SAM protein [Clostridium tarantellae]